MTLDWGLMIHSLPLLLKGAWLTVQITLFSIFIGTIIGFIIGIMRVSSSPYLSTPAVAYVEFIRGTPLLVQLFIIHFATPQLIGFSFEAYTSAVIAMSVNSGAYVAEIVRGGIQSIERGQMEAARSLGMNYPQAMGHIILPQAVRRILPALGNEFIALLKDSSLVSVITLEELTRKGQLIIGRTYKPFEIWIMVALIYLVMTLTMSRLVAYLERRTKTND